MWTARTASLRCRLQGSACVVAAQNVVLHSVGQLVPPTLVMGPHMHRLRCAHPKSPQSLANPLQEGYHVQPKRAVEIPLQEP